MRRFIQFYRDHARKIRNYTLFAVTTVILILLFPRLGRFRYEFQKGKPWMHEEYIAPFDFPIYKTDETLERERDSILSDFKPYFNKDILVREKMMNQFSRTFNRFWNETQDGSTDLSSQELEQDRQIIRNFITGLLESVYDKGIIDNSEVLERSSSDDPGIVVLVQHIAEEVSAHEIFTQKTAYEFITRELNLREDSLPFSDYQPLINRLNINELLEANLIYNEETSNTVRQEMINSISLTQGMVQSGELVISRGELIDAEKYRILESLRREYEINLGFSDRFNIITVGKILLIILSMVILYLFLMNFRPEILDKFSHLTFLVLLVVIVSALASFIIRYDFLSIYVLPLAIIPIMIRTFFDSRLALFVHMLTVLIIGFWAPNGFEFVYLNIIAGIVALFSLTNSYRRGILFLTSVIIVLGYSLVYLSFSVIQEGNFSSIEYRPLLWFTGNGFLLLTAYPLTFIFEKSFGFLSDSTLLELSDANQPLLRKLAEQAPGTFQHSLQVANLSEAAVYEIGGNPLLIRTGALYHDIGKMVTPQYYIENQHSGYNPHSELKFEESAELIINHVKQGVEIAKKHNLPDAIVDFIRTHHGTTMVQYFYRSFLKNNPEKETDLNRFTYPGPKPFSRETAILMMADSVEASSRSLQVKDEETINNLIEKIIDDQVKQEQFDAADITFRDIKRIKELFKKKLKEIYHYRIEYPE